MYPYGGYQYTEQYVGQYPQTFVTPGVYSEVVYPPQQVYAEVVYPQQQVYQQVQPVMYQQQQQQVVYQQQQPVMYQQQQVAVAPMRPTGVVAPAPGFVMPPPGQSVFTTPVTFQVRKNYTVGEMDIWLNGFPYYKLISNPAPTHVFGWGHNYALYDLMNNQLAYIEQVVRVGLPHFDILIKGQRYAKLKKEFTILKKLFHLDSSVSGEHIKIHGDWFAMSFRFERSDGKCAATCTGNSTNDMYDVTIQPGEDSLMILLAVLTVEKLCRN
jgi:uncharacterized protein YxjI